MTALLDLASDGQGHLSFEYNGAHLLIARIDQSGLRAEAAVYLYDPLSLAVFLRELAESWRGWEGMKEWESLEGDLALNASADRYGHVKIEVALCPH